jgi:hypothetical protein
MKIKADSDLVFSTWGTLGSTVAKHVRLAGQITAIFVQILDTVEPVLAGTPIMFPRDILRLLSL